MEIVNREEFYEIAPITSKEIDWDKEIVPVIGNIMQIEIKQQIPDYYVGLIEWLKTKDEYSCYFKLWEGGEYSDNCNNKFIFEGLKKAFIYYLYAHLIKQQGAILGQTGYREYTDNYSQLVEIKKTESNYQYYKQIADSYMVDCFQFLKSCRELTPCGVKSGKRTQFITIIES